MEREQKEKTTTTGDALIDIWRERERVRERFNTHFTYDRKHAW